MAALDATERERDDASEQSTNLAEALKAAAIAAEVHLNMAEEAEADRNAIYAMFLPWGLANGHPEME